MVILRTDDGWRPMPPIYAIARDAVAPWMIRTIAQTSKNSPNRPTTAATAS